jgi:hypothetical protein
MATANSEFWSQVREAQKFIKQAEQTGELLRDQFNAREQQSPDWVIATPTTNDSRPRTKTAEYWKDERVLRLTFRNDQAYLYFEVSPQQASSIKRVQSTGKLIDRRLNSHPYCEDR